MEPTADGDYSGGPRAVGPEAGQEATHWTMPAGGCLLTVIAASWQRPVFAERRSRYHERAGVSVLAELTPTCGQLPTVREHYAFCCAYYVEARALQGPPGDGRVSTALPSRGQVNLSAWPSASRAGYWEGSSCVMGGRGQDWEPSPLHTPIAVVSRQAQVYRLPVLSP
jgi:hypothetical protein